MKPLVTWLAAMILVPGVAQSNPPRPAETWTNYGAPISLKKTSRLAPTTTKLIGKELMFAGTVSEVCQNKGCWITVRDGKEEVRVEFKDYGFFVPWEAEGKPIRLQGVLTERVMSSEEQAHLAEESKRGGDAGEAKPKPKKVRVFVANGVAIKGGGEISPEQQRKISGEKNADEHDHDHGKEGPKH